MIDAVLKGEYDAGSVSHRTFRTMAQAGPLDQDSIRTFWTSAGYSHCCFTAQGDMNSDEYRIVEQALLSVNYGDTIGKTILDAEACKSIVPGIDAGWDALEKAAEDQGLI